jgi:hypothetical protein
MNLAKAPAAYVQSDEQLVRDTIAREDVQNVKKGRDIVMRGGRPGTRDPRVILYSPSGDPFYLTVADDGTLGAAAL